MTPEATEIQLQTTSAMRVGVILCELGKLNVTALKYLVVHLNTLQRSIEFELLAPDPSDPLLAALANGEVADREKCRGMLAAFRERILIQFEHEAVEYGLADRSL